MKVDIILDICQSILVLVRPDQSTCSMQQSVQISYFFNAPFIVITIFIFIAPCIASISNKTKPTRKPERQKPKLTRKPSSVEFNARWVIYMSNCGSVVRESQCVWVPGCLNSGVLGSFVVRCTNLQCVKLFTNTGYEWSSVDCIYIYRSIYIIYIFFCIYQPQGFHGASFWTKK